jgi:hypothetical protein
MEHGFSQITTKIKARKSRNETAHENHEKEEVVWFRAFRALLLFVPFVIVFRAFFFVRFVSP